MNVSPWLLERTQEDVLSYSSSPFTAIVNPSRAAHLVQLFYVSGYLCNTDDYPCLVVDKEVLDTLRVLGALGPPNLKTDRGVLPKIILGLLF